MEKAFKEMYTLFSFKMTENNKMLYPLISAFPTSFEEFYKNSTHGQNHKRFINHFSLGAIDLSKIAPELWNDGPPDRLKRELERLVEDRIKRGEENGESKERLEDLKMLLEPFPDDAFAMGGATVTYDHDMNIKNFEFEDPRKKRKKDQNKDT